MYTITLDPNGGSLSETSINVQYDRAYSLPVLTRNGYTFDGWFDGANEISDTGTWYFASNKTFTAHWSIITYSITYELDGGTNAANNPSTYTIESEYTLSAPTKTGYTFEGWYKEDTKITSIPRGSTGDMKLFAKWAAILYKLTVVSEDDSKGAVSISSGSGYTSESITVTATPADDCVFKGWYHESVKVSDASTYTFTMPANDYSLVARFFTKAKEEEWQKNHGVIPTLSEDGKTITYGLYPQTNVNDQATIDELNKLTTSESNGWYLYNDEYYAKAVAKPYDDSGYVFNNGTEIVEGKTYWFRCEPIIWNVLSGENGEYFILSSVLLVTHRYDDDSNDYAKSEIRAWLNDEFYKSAFALGDKHIQTKNVDNSADDTKDKIFLPIFDDYMNVDYGFEHTLYQTESRECKTTDYARANGAFGGYWTSSGMGNAYPYVQYARTVGTDGNLDGSGYVRSTHYGVRPALILTLNSLRSDNQ